MWPFRKREPKLPPEMEYAVHKTAEAIKEHYRPKNISEPVRAIAQAMRERPGSFRIEWLTGEVWTEPELHEKYRITDRRTGLVAVCLEKYMRSRPYEIRLPFALTHDETEYLWAEGEKWLSERRQRTEDYINTKRRREWSRKYGVES